MITNCLKQCTVADGLLQCLGTFFCHPLLSVKVVVMSQIRNDCLLIMVY